MISNIIWSGQPEADLQSYPVAGVSGNSSGARRFFKTGNLNRDGTDIQRKITGNNTHL